MRSIDYIGHQISGDVRGNIKQVLAICRQLHLDDPAVLPVAPYVTCLLYLDDHIAEERDCGISSDKQQIAAMADRLRIHGPKLSTGLTFEAKYFRDLGRPIILANPDLATDLERVLEGYPFTVEPFALRPDVLNYTNTLLKNLGL